MSAYPFGECFGETLVEVYRAARQGLRHFRDGTSHRANEQAIEFMTCARGNLWRVVCAREPAFYWEGVL